MIRTFGVIGSWGSGKTSFINLLKHKDKQDTQNIYVDYNIFRQEHISGGNQRYSKLYILTQFLEIEFKTHNINDSNVLILLRELAHFSSFSLSIEKITSIRLADPHLRGYKEIIKDIKQELEALLTSLKRKIIIVYDDLDRITDPEEILGLLRLVDLINDIRSEWIAQIVSYDHSKLLDILSEFGSEISKENSNTGGSNKESSSSRVFYEKYIERIIGQKFEIDGYNIMSIKTLIKEISENDSFKDMPYLSNEIQKELSYWNQENFLRIFDYIKVPMRSIKIFSNNIVNAFIIYSVGDPILNVQKKGDENSGVGEEEDKKQKNDKNSSNEPKVVAEHNKGNNNSNGANKCAEQKKDDEEVAKYNITSYIDIRILILTQLLKTLSLEQYNDAKDFFMDIADFKIGDHAIENKFDSVLKKISDSVAIKTITEYIYNELSKKISKIQNDDNILLIIGVLFELFGKVHQSAQYDKQLHISYKQFVSYHFPEILIFGTCDNTGYSERI
ncbi:P-loop NTPase fold protein [Candidatus Cyrtobacter comes]|nr:P-loop NTPase fold protein [Candidatus Cyrtobacter comes]